MHKDIETLYFSIEHDKIAMKSPVELQPALREIEWAERHLMAGLKEKDREAVMRLINAYDSLVGWIGLVEFKAGYILGVTNNNRR